MLREDFELRAAASPNQKYATAVSEKQITFPIVRLIDRDDKVFTMGSCFAEEIRLHLQNAGFTCVPRYRRIQFDPERISIDTLPDREHMNFYNTFTVLQQLQQITGQWTQDKDDFWIAPKISKKVIAWEQRPLYQDPYKRLVLAKTPEELHLAVSIINDEMRSSFEGATAFVFTFGMAEVFRNKRNGKIVCQKPSYAGGGGLDETVYHQSTVAENIESLRSIVRLIRERKPEAPIFLTVSPVPLERTFGSSDIVAANCEGKSILRSAVGQVVRESEKVFYVPSYEYVSSMGLSAFRQDGRHVLPEVVEKIVESFVQAHVVQDEAVEVIPEPDSVRPTDLVVAKKATSDAAHVKKRKRSFLANLLRFGW